MLFAKTAVTASCCSTRLLLSNVRPTRGSRSRLRRENPEQQVLLYVPPRAAVRNDDDVPAYQVVAFWDGAYWVAAYDEIDRVNGPTHWMPLRDPPEQ